jgi:zinc protease
MKRLFVLLALAATTAAAKPVDVPVVYYRLGNGLKVVVSEAHAAPTVTVAVYYGIGFRVEPKGQTGFAHLFEHMMFQGSAHVKKFEHAKLVEQNGGQLNGSTRLDFTNYFETLPSNAVETALWLEADRMRSLEVTDENLKNQQNVVSEEIRVNVLNQPYALFEWLDIWQNANQNWFNAHNFYGDLHDLEAAKIADVQQFFKTYYAPNNAVLAVVGDVDPAAVRPMIEKYFGDIPLQSVPERPDISEPKQAKEKRLTQTDKLANVPAFALAYHIADHDSPDFAPTVLLNLILQGDDSSRLFQRLVKEKAISLDWAGGINFELGNEFDYDGPMLMVSRTTYKPGHTGEEILKEVDAVVRELQEHGVTKKELDAAKVRFRSNFYSQLESTFGKANLLASFALFNDDPQRINKVVALYDAVTPEQIKSAAQRYLTPENRTSIDRVPEKKEAK